MYRIILSLLLLAGVSRVVTGQGRPVQAKINIKGATHLSSEELTSIIPSRIDSGFTEQLLDRSLTALSQYYAGLGYPFADIKIASIIPQDSSINITIIITEGRLARVDSIAISGATVTNASIIEREFFLDERPFAAKTYLQSSVDRLRHIGIFSSVSDASIFPTSDSTVGVLLAVQEIHSTEIDGVLGYNPPTIPGTQGYLNGFLDLGFLNIGGTARQAILHYSKITPSSSELQASYKEPWLFDFPVDASVAMARYIDDSLYTATDLSLSFSLHTTSPLTIGANAAATFVTPGVQQIVQTSNTLAIGLFCRYDKRDDPIVMRNGYLVSLQAQYGSKSATDSLGFALTAPMRALDATFEAARPMGFHSLIGSITITAKQRASRLLEVSDLFRLGGLHSLRGYAENSFLSDQYIIARSELRFMLEQHSYIGLFCDIGSVQQVVFTPTEPSPSFFQSAPIGFGLSMLFDSPIGFIQVAVAAPKQASLDRSLLHFGLKTSL